MAGVKALSPFGEEKKELGKEQLQNVSAMAKEISLMVDGGGDKKEPDIKSLKDPEKQAELQARADKLIASFKEEKNIVVWSTAFKKLKADYRQLAQVDFPELMQSVGMKDLTLDNGQKVIVKDKMQVSVAKKNIMEVKKEMISCELDFIVEEQRKIKPFENEKETAEFRASKVAETQKMVYGRFKESVVIEEPTDEVIDYLFEKECEYSKESKIAAQTLKKVVGDMKARGVNVPASISLYEYKETDIK